MPNAHYQFVYNIEHALKYNQHMCNDGVHGQMTKGNQNIQNTKKISKVFPLKKNFINLKNATSKSKRQNL